jgi:hypothetical protein
MRAAVVMGCLPFILRTVDFDDQPCGVAAEGDGIAIDGDLASELRAVETRPSQASP